MVVGRALEPIDLDMEGSQYIHVNGQLLNAPSPIIITMMIIKKIVSASLTNGHHTGRYSNCSE